ncbi:hypothetical protein [Rubrivivax sp. JA1055]|uniref:hypothetical protein n=2 Tax=unclassified Rubrivivax TaxID=2649762 RepID=UPI001E4B124D|nr:hypothetical protein [Rubrivivax sp. JA1055]MCC9595325.1 hypothetical protein [Rubrivivax sp. JA1055]
MRDTLTEFLAAADAWICDGYALDIRYAARPSGRGFEIFSASIGLHPLKAQTDVSFTIDTGNLLVGQHQRCPVPKAALLQILEDASRGLIRVEGRQLHLPGNAPHSHYSDSSARDSWFSPLHLQTTGGAGPGLSSTQLLALDNELRASTPPFDGLNDLFAWLDLEPAALAGRPSSVTSRIAPPADLIVDQCKLADEVLTLILHAHPSFLQERIGLMVRAVPGNGIRGRMQVSSEISWQPSEESKREAVAKISLKEADSALVVLMVGSATVRRQWFIDPSKARNNRLLAVQHFDHELRKVREAVLETGDSRRFEQGIASLLFVLGFSPAIQIETDSPDLIVSTPGGRLLIVECTLRIADFQQKLGKLVDRRASLEKYLKNSGHFSEVHAALVCRLPRDQIAALSDSLLAHKILLASHEDLTAGFLRVRHAVDPDEIIQSALKNLAATSGSPSTAAP